MKILAQTITERFNPSIPEAKFGLGSHHKLLWMMAFFTAFLAAIIAWQYYREWRIRRFYEKREWRAKKPWNGGLKKQ